MRDLAPEKKAKGIESLDALDRSLTEFQTLIDVEDKQVGGSNSTRALKCCSFVLKCSVLKCSVRGIRDSVLGIRSCPSS